MTHFKALILGLYAVFYHALAERAHGGHGVIEYLVAKVAGAAVKRSHLGEQLGGLQTLLGLHAGRSAGGGDHYNVGQFGAYSVHNHAETLPVLRGRTVVLADMHMYYGRAGVVGALSLAHHLFDGVRNVWVLLLSNFGAADGGGDYQLLHQYLLSCSCVGSSGRNKLCSAYLCSMRWQSLGVTQVPCARQTTMGSSRNSAAEALMSPRERMTLRASKLMVRLVLPTRSISPTASI